MSENKQVKHTPGPWAAKKFSGGVMVAIVLGPDGKHAVASVNSEANARLIAAAPELLRDLSFLVQASETEPGMNIYRAHIARAKASVAKAEGR